MAWNTAFPPAEFFKEFDKVTANGAERLFNNYIEETQHRRLMERRSQLFPFIIANVGRACAAVVALGILAVAVVAINHQAYWLAAFFGATVLAAVINAFLRRG
jgi:uncharacterized membrane protein